MNEQKQSSSTSTSRLAATNRKNILVVLGEAGAGKSTFINCVTEKVCCNVSHERNKDGTSKVEGPHTSPKLNFSLIDTVGLGSKNFRNYEGEIKKKLVEANASDNVAIMLVCRLNAPRWTIWLNDFKSVISTLCVSKRKIIVYWVGTKAALKDQDEAEMRNALLNVEVCFVHELSEQSELSELNCLVQENLNTLREDLQSAQSNVAVKGPSNTPFVQTAKKSGNLPITEQRPEARSIFMSESSLQAKASSGERKNHPLHILCTQLKTAIQARSGNGRDEYCGRVNIIHTLTCQAVNLGIDDIECAVNAVASPASLARIFNIIARVDPASMATFDEQTEDEKAQAIEKLVWRLYTYEAYGKLKKNACAVEYFRIMRMLTEKLVLAVDKGDFEQYVNTMSSQDDRSQSIVLRNVNKVVHSHRDTANAILAGSRNKHTNVDKKSDIDIWVLCVKEIDETVRIVISESIASEFEGDCRKVYKTNATAFTWNHKGKLVEFDVVFSKNSFSSAVSQPPNRDNFYNRPGRQRVVKAFKLLQRDAPDQFTPTVSSCVIEDFVVSVDEAKGSVEDSSGAFLFVQCLLELCHTTIGDHKWTATAKAVCTGKKIGVIGGLMAILREMGIRYVGRAD